MSAQSWAPAAVRSSAAMMQNKLSKQTWTNEYEQTHIYEQTYMSKIWEQTNMNTRAPTNESEQVNIQIKQEL